MITSKNVLTAAAAAAMALGMALAPAAAASATTNSIYAVVGDHNHTTVFAAERWHNTVVNSSITLTHTPACGGWIYMKWRNAQTAVVITQTVSWESGLTGIRYMKNTAGGWQIQQQWFKQVVTHTGNCDYAQELYIQGSIVF